MESSQIREELAKYSLGFRVVEITALLTFAGLFALVAVSLADAGEGRAWLVIAGAPFGLVVMDFLSGLVHWFADTWGSATWPVVGPTLIRSFREHHVDKLAITRHDFVETNGATALVSLPLLILAAALKPWYAEAPVFFGVVTLSSIAFWGLWTNQFHKWSHMARPPAVVRFFQRRGIALSIGHHALHHCGNYDRHYCITAGWLNPLLDRVGFFRRAEALITALTGAQPRAEDLELTTATRRPAPSVGI